MTAPPNFLIVRVAALGDIAVASALLRRIRATHPGASVTWLTSARGAELVSLFGVDEIVAIDEQRLLRGAAPARAGEILKAWRALAGRRFESILVLHADWRYRILTMTARGRIRTLRWGGGGADAIPALTRFRGDEYARLLDDTFEGPQVERHALADVRSALGPAQRTDLNPRVALVPGGARNVLRDDGLRRWPVASYAMLAEALENDGCEVILVGDESDAWVRPAFAGTSVRDEIGKRDLKATLALLRDCDVVVSHDTGPIHFARLVRTPIVGLFGPTDARHVVGEGGGEGIVTLRTEAQLPCSPCYDGRNYARCASNVCMQTISVDAVAQAVRGSLARRMARGTQEEPSIRIVV